MAHLRSYFERLDDFQPTSVMSLEEVREMAEVHEVGAHSYEHATMPAESDDYTRADVLRCQRYFSVAIGHTPSVYAFPNGVARRTQAEIVHQDFSAVLLTACRLTLSPTWLYSRHLVYGSTQAEVRFRALGGSMPRPRA